MNIRSLLANAVRNFRGVNPEDSNGAAGLSGYVGITATSLSHKVSPTYPTANCSPEEVVLICRYTNDHAPMQAMAKALGYVLLPVMQDGVEMDAAYVTQVTASAKEFGEFLAESTASFADNNVDDAEMARVTKEFIDSISAQSRLFATVQAQHLACKRKGGRGLVDLPVRGDVV